MSVTHSRKDDGRPVAMAERNPMDGFERYRPAGHSSTTRQTLPPALAFFPHRQNRFSPGVAAASLLLVCSIHVRDATAVTAPDAGVLRQQIENNRATPLPKRSAPEEAAPRPGKAADQGATVTVKKFRFAGNTLISGEQLATSTAPYLNHPVNFNELQQAVAAVGKTYRDAGWAVRAYLPKQEITDGVVTIRVVEAIFAGAHLEGPAPARVPRSQVLAYFNNGQQKPGEHLSTRILDRALLLANDLPGVAVTAALQQGEKFGETQLLVHTTDEPAFASQLTADNAGARSTGSERIIGSLHVNSPLKRGDRIDGNLLHSKGSDYLWLNYSLPVGSDGWRVNFNGSYLRYRLTSSDFSSLHAKGTSKSLGLGASYPLIRERLQNLYLNFNYSRDSFHNEANASTQSDYLVDILNAGLNGNLFDEFAGGGSSSLSISLTAGNLDQKTLDAGETPSLDGAFTKASFSVSRRQTITDQLSLYAAFRGQLSDDNLDSSQRFYLGGPNGVRAYPVNEGSGSRGLLANLELGYRLPYNLTMSGFYDWGHIGNLDASPSYELKGYGLGLSWLAPNNFELKAMLARRDGNNPNPTATGRDQDGSLDRTRLWLAASFRF